jgi:hypothetical protein
LIAVAVGCTPKKDVNVVPCARGPAKPLGVAVVKKTFRRVGIDLRRYANGCDHSIVAVVENVSGGDANARDTLARYGHVSCTIEVSPVYGRSVRRYKEEGGGRYIFDLENVECSLHPTGDRAASQVRRVAAAMRSLARG